MTRVMRGHNRWSARPAATQGSVLDVLIGASRAAWRHYYGITAHGIGVVTFKITSEMFDRAALVAIERGIALPIASVPVLETPDQIDGFELDHPDGFRLRIERSSSTSGVLGADARSTRGKEG